MKYYRIPISPNCRKAEATIYHLNIDAEIITKDIMAGELELKDYMQINPNGKVPSLVDGEFNLWESNAIIQYLADKVNADDFFPKALQPRADMVRWQFWGALHFNRAVSTICWETVAKPAMKIGQPDQAIIASAMDDYHRFATVLNNHLSDRTFITGDQPTVADFSVGDHSALALYDNSQIPLDKYPNIKTWYERLEDIPAWAKTAPSL